MPSKLPISLCMFVKNSESNLSRCIESVLPVVSEIVILDTGSTDSTMRIAKSYTDLVYSVNFSDYSSCRNVACGLASKPWILSLDDDETLDPNWDKLKELVNQPLSDGSREQEKDRQGNVIIDSWALPRKRWEDPWLAEQSDIEAYPDWQVRLFRNYTNGPRIKYVRKVHETIRYARRTEHSIEGPVIHHFQNVHKDCSNLAKRHERYVKLYNEDLEEGYEHTEPPVIEEDKV